MIERIKDADYISLTDIAKQTERPPAESIRDWLRNASTLMFLETWETLHNKDFKVGQMHQFRNDAVDNRKAVSPQRYTEETGAVGIISKSGRYGGTLAHSDIALNFCYWLSPSFQVYLLQEFQRLKEQEADIMGLSWDLRRELAKANFYIHTDAVRENLVPALDWNTKWESIRQASEADLLNLSLFGMTAREWKLQNPEAKGNMRDQASIEQLLVLANLESLNAEFIRLGYDRDQRIRLLHKAAQTQMEVIAKLAPVENIKKLNR